MDDAVVVGSGPNGLAAAVTLARCGLRVTVLEARPTPGGGARTLDLGLADGVVHDICSAVHPMAWASPFFRGFDLRAHGVELLTPEVQFAQPLPGGRAAVAYRSVERTAERLGPDAAAWRGLLGPLARQWRVSTALALGDHRSVPPGFRPDGAVRFGRRLLEQGTVAWNLRFRGDEAAALVTGVAAHTITRLPSLAGAGTALLLASLAHAAPEGADGAPGEGFDGGWPIPRGGSGAIVAALLADLEAHGGTVVTDHPVRSRADLPPARAYLFDTPPSTLLQVVGDAVPERTRRALDRFPRGAAAAKVDLVLDGPVPWADPEVRRAGTVHVAGTRDEMVRADAAVTSGRHAERPVVLVSDPTVVDAGREVGGLRPLWTYAHVPAGSDVDVTEAVVAQIERFAPGFRDVVVAARCTPAAQMEHHNPAYLDGDISGGSVTMWRMIARPTASLDPYRAAGGVYLCSSSTPPGPGVHGMAGWHAARRALRQVFGVRVAPL